MSQDQQNLKPLIVTIDGPAGSGKSTVSSQLAKRLHLTFLTTGAFYRGLAILCHRKNADLANEDEVASLAQYPGFSITANENGTLVSVDGEDVTGQLHNEDIAAIASRISSLPAVRFALLDAQRTFQATNGLIAEGRDCGTVVFPEAQVKIFLTASLNQRAARRQSEEKASTSEEVKQRLASRDNADSQRKASPMIKARDAIEIDTSTLSIAQVVDKIESIVKEKWAKK